MPIGNILVVEDDKDWREIYVRNAQPRHAGTLRIAVTLEEALEAIKELAFAVAFVDIRLDEGDDQNTDGLRVLEELRRTRDHTSAIMLTGHGTVAITRDALKEFDAYEAIEKESNNDPVKLQELVIRATDDRNHRAQVEDPPAPEILRGRRTVWDWDSEMLEVTGSKGGADGLYRLVESLANPFLPLVDGLEAEQIKRHEGTNLAAGTFWSRAVGLPVLIVFGQAQAVREAQEGAELGRLAGHSLGEVLREREKAGLAGLVVAVSDRPRSMFS